jgi:TRAP-type C4-dicarboxylate transport system permease small subunit
VKQIKALIVGLAFAVVLVAQSFTLAAFLSGKVMANNVAMIAWSDAQAAMVLLVGGILATFVLIVAMFRRRRGN